MAAPPDRSPADRWHPPLVWRVLQVTARAVCAVVCRLRVSGDVPERLRYGPLILASNHIGLFDPISLTAACGVRQIAPRMLATGGLFRAPVVGPVLRGCGHIRVDRREASATQAQTAAEQALAAGSVLAVYPEGRITLDPGVWPERGRSGPARLALSTGAVVVPVAQWGAHEVLAWHGWGRMLGTLLRAATRRPVVRVHFGAPVDLGGLRSEVAGDPLRATDRILDAITETLRPLRADEPRLPRYVDLTRPVSTARSHRRRARGGRAPAAGGVGGSPDPARYGDRDGSAVAAHPQVRQDGLPGGAHAEYVTGLGDAAVGGTQG